MTTPPGLAPGQGAPAAISPDPGTGSETALSDLDVRQRNAELLDPERWAEILSRFGRTMKLAVALTDVHGKLLGPCHNPQPVWSLAQQRAPGLIAPGSCPACAFCLAPETPCHAVADAFATGQIALAHDTSGLTHVAIPLFLGNQRLGALIAGQVFTQYPQPLVIQRVAKQSGAPPQELWNAAVHQLPLSHATLHLYADLLASLGHAFLHQRYAAILDRKLHVASERYRLMIEGLKDHALFTVDGEGHVTSWNPGAEQLLGYVESEVIGDDYGRFFTPEDGRRKTSRDIRMAMQKGRIEEEGWQVRKDGTRFYSETVMARLGEGEEREYGRLLHDVTEQRKVAEATLQAQKLESIGVLAAGMAHDFNNLLTSILGNVSLAMEELPADDPNRLLLDVAEQSSLTAAALITQLMSYAGNGIVVVTRFDLSGLVAEILPLIQTAIPKMVQLDLSLAHDLPWIMADASEIKQIVMNLVINGAEAFGPAGGRLRVSTGTEELNSDQDGQPDGVFLEVRDSGCGMDEATIRRIFDPFFTTKFPGRGLGLAAVSGIVRRLKGRLNVESVPGEGSTFRVVFPGVPAQVPEAKAVAKDNLQGTGLILVVDDEPQVCKLAQVALERYGFSVLTAENGQEAVTMFRSNAEITAVLMDLTMPVMNGGEAFKLMNEIRPDVPIIISSGYGESAVRNQFTSALAGVIKKPYTMSELREKVAAVLLLKKTADSRKRPDSGS